VPRFLAARGGGGASAEDTAHIHIHGKEAKGNEARIKYFASSDSWTATTVRVRVLQGVATTAFAS
jgi:hypothetical protein